MAVKSFQLEFQSQGEKYIADIWHHNYLTEEEKIKYRVREYSFLVHLFSLKGFKSFEVFIDEDSMQWVTNAEELVDPELVMTLGERIDDRFG